MRLSQSFFRSLCHGECTGLFAYFPFLHTMAAVNPVNPLSFAGCQAHRRHNIEVLHRAGKSPQEITQQTGYKKKSGGVAFGMYGFDVVKLS